MEGDSWTLFLPAPVFTGCMFLHRFSNPMCLRFLLYKVRPATAAPSMVGMSGRSPALNPLRQCPESPKHRENAVWCVCCVRVAPRPDPLCTQGSALDNLVSISSTLIGVYILKFACNAESKIEAGSPAPNLNLGFTPRQSKPTGLWHNQEAHPCWTGAGFRRGERELFQTTHAFLYPAPSASVSLPVF